MENFGIALRTNNLDIVYHRLKLISFELVCQQHIYGYIKYINVNSPYIVTYLVILIAPVPRIILPLQVVLAIRRRRSRKEYIYLLSYFVSSKLNYIFSGTIEQPQNIVVLPTLAPYGQYTLYFRNLVIWTQY